MRVPGSVRRRAPRQLDVDRIGDLLSNLALKTQNISYSPLVGLGPHVALIANLNKLCANTCLITLSPHAPFQDVAYIQLTSDLPDVLFFILVPRDRGARDDPEPLAVQAGHLGNDLFGETFTKIVLVRVITEVIETQDRQHDFSGRQALHRNEEAIPAPRQGLDVPRLAGVITQCDANSRDAGAQSLLDVDERVLTPQFSPDFFS